MNIALIKTVLSNLILFYFASSLHSYLIMNIALIKTVLSNLILFYFTSYFFIMLGVVR